MSKEKSTKELTIEELEKKGFGVAEPSSPDYVVDIQFKGKTIAFYTKADLIEKNPFVEVPQKQMERLFSMARATTNLCGICSDQPYEEEKVQKLKNGVVKVNEHNGVVLACRKHPLFDYVLSKYSKSPKHTVSNNSFITCNSSSSVISSSNTIWQ